MSPMTTARADATVAAARQAGLLFAFVGFIGFIADLLQFGIANGRPVALLFDTANIAVGVIGRMLPWSRWHPRAPLVFPLLAFAVIDANAIAGVLPQVEYGIWFVLVFIWVGMWQPPRTALSLGPIATLAYLVPFFIRPDEQGSIAGSVVVSIPVALLIGETLSRTAAAARVAKAGQDAALSALSKASVTDDLTGLGNRRRANALLDSLSDGDGVVILDIDHFKQVNDTLGHHRGDKVLQDLGAFLLASVRDHDDVARYGGEEFVLVVRRSDGPALGVAEHILGRWRASNPPVTLSAGIAEKLAGRSWSQTFADADRALYAAKHAGRDRAVLWKPDPLTRVDAIRPAIGDPPAIAAPASSDAR